MDLRIECLEANIKFALTGTREIAVILTDVDEESLIADLERSGALQGIIDDAFDRGFSEGEEAKEAYLASVEEVAYEEGYKAGLADVEKDGSDE